MQTIEGPLCRIYVDLLAEMEHIFHNYVFISVYLLNLRLIVFLFNRLSLL